MLDVLTGIALGVISSLALVLVDDLIKRRKQARFLARWRYACAYSETLRGLIKSMREEPDIWDTGYEGYAEDITDRDAFIAFWRQCVKN